jgi:hypothetical protein
MWSETHNNIQPTKDIFQELMALEGELDDEKAKATLAEFLFHNPAFMMDLIGGMKIYPMQEIVMKGWARNDYNLMVAGRGASKSWLAALFSIYWAIFNPGCRVVIISFAFRASRRILEQCQRFVSDKDAKLLKLCFPNDLRRGTDEYKWELPNGASIVCLPLGDGKKIRGVRADLLIVDEFAYLPETIIGEILRPFLTANNKIKEQRTITEREDAMIARGEMSEAERTILEDRKKVIFLSSACYQFEHMYKRYTDWVDLLTRPEKQSELKKSGVSYFIARISYEACPDGMLNMREIDEAKRDISEAMFNREYRAIFTSDSDGFFRATKMMQCSVKDGETPCLELVGEKGAEYILGIDVSLSGSESSDDFAICVLKREKQADGKDIGRVVHNYAVAGGSLKDHIIYLYFLLKNFNVVYIAVDASQGDEVEFINACNQSKLFKENNISLSDVEADFKKNNYHEQPAQIKKSYNRTIGRIVQKQPFSADFLRASNEYLQACFDHQWIRFAGKIAANDSASTAAMNVDLSMLRVHEEFKETSMHGFIENQDVLLDLTRKECAMIEVKTNDLGTMTFGLPQNLKRTSGANRVRRDSYTALLLASWALRMYNQSLEVETQVGPIDFPYELVGNR